MVFWRRRLVDNQIWASLVTTRTEDIQFLETFRFNHLKVVEMSKDRDQCNQMLCHHLGLPWDGN